MPFVVCCALVYFWTLRFSRIGDFYTLRLGFFGNLDLRIILRQIREGNEDAFKSLFETYFTPLCRFIYLHLDDKNVAEELAMDIFIYLWENRETFQIQLSLKAYLFQAAKNKCLNELRKKKETVGLDGVEVSTINTSVSALETEELYRLIQEAVFSLPDKCRNIFLLSRRENLTNQEIARKLNISVKTVEGQITKALKKIKKFLGDQYSYLW